MRRMSSSQIPAVKDIVLVGGGHSHALVIRMWAMNPVPGLRFTLISPQVNTPYSGMLPGLLAGHYSFEQAHIDLVRLCTWAGVRFIQAEVVGIDPTQKVLELKDRPNLEYDVCSMDIGSTPSEDIEGSSTYAVGVKPISRFYEHWCRLQKELQTNQTGEPSRVAIIGGGHGGVEVILAMKHWTNEHGVQAKFVLCHRGPVLWESSPKRQQIKLMDILARENIEVHLNFECQRISAKELHGTNKGKPQSIPYDKVFCCTHASAAMWLRATDLLLSERGFIRVNECLQAVGHDDLFAAGDVCHLDHDPRPKAGVYAVRMGPILFKNLLNVALDKPLLPYQPQKDFLSLSALGAKVAMGKRNGFGFSGAWVWWWKDRIDQKFMKMFQDLSDMGSTSSPSASEDITLAPALQKHLGIKDIRELAMRCGGCGGKVGASVLSEVLKSLQVIPRSDVIAGLDDPDDAAILSIPEDHLLVQTVDVLKTLVDDPYVFGQISALHALSDIFAMNAQPQSAQAMVQLPLMVEQLQIRDMKQLMTGALNVLNAHNCTLVGGHTSEESNLNLGFTINALSPKGNAISRKRGVANNDVLILTKPLGTGALFAAAMRAKAKGTDVELAIQSMLQSNQSSAHVLQKSGVSACTDVTGFGLLGHLAEMLKGSDVGVELWLNDLPVFSGALGALEEGITSSLQPQNVRMRRILLNQQDFIDHPSYPLLFDPQTSGGLLATVPESQLESCLESLKEAGSHEARCIGRVSGDVEARLVRLLEGADGLLENG